jgi:gamma-polyglutamate biosynthesis protein CapA
MSITMYAVGDIMLGETPLSFNFGVKSIIKKKGAREFFKTAQKIFENGDIVFGNLEAPLSDQTEKIGFDAGFFIGDPNIALWLKQSHFSVLSVANNHIMEHGNIAFQKTVNTLLQNGIIPVGIKDDIKIMKIKNSSVAFLAYSFIGDGIEKPLYNIPFSSEKIFSDIKSVRNDVDFLILSVHWGNEYVPFPSPHQVSFGRQLIDSGVDIILGSHPHVIQGYEIYKNRPIIYSLGNFIFENTFIPNTRNSAIACIQLNLEERDITIKMIPVILDKQEFFPIIATGSQRESIIKIFNEIRDLLDNRSVENYSTELGNYQKLISKYKRMAKMNMKTHYAKNILKFSPQYSLSMLIRFLKKHT